MDSGSELYPLPNVPIKFPVLSNLATVWLSNMVTYKFPDLSNAIPVVKPLPATGATSVLTGAPSDRRHCTEPLPTATNTSPLLKT